MRTIRRNVLGVVYHVIWRFVDRRWFMQDSAERGVYLQFLGSALDKSDWRCLAYALMSSHIHFAMLAGSQALASWSRRVHSPFAAWMNEQHGRLGPVFAQSAKDHAIVPAKEAHLLAYIHNNPVRASVASTARESGWTSHRAYIGYETAPRWLHVDEGLARIGMSADDFGSWVDREPGESGVTAVERIGRTARHRGALRVATPSVAAVPLIGRPFAHVRIAPTRLIELAAELTDVDALLVCSRRRVSEALVARRAIVHVARAMGLSDMDTAESLGLSQQGVSKIGARQLTHAERDLYEVLYERARFELSGVSGVRP